MSNFVATIDDVLATDAKFQAWVQAVESAMLASGFLEVAPDTGQLNPATVVRPAVGAYAGYRIYRAKDSLKTSNPFYVKFEYGVSASAQDRGVIRRLVGTGSNGAGTLTGAGGAMSASNSSPSSTGSGVMTIAGGGGANFVWFMAQDTAQTSHNILWMGGRLLNPTDGSPKVPIIWESWGSSALSVGGGYMWDTGSGSWSSASQGFSSHFPDLSQTIQSGGNVSTTLLYQGQVYRNAETLVFPCLNGKTSEVPYTDPVSSMVYLNIWGGSHGFLPMPFTGFASSRVLLLAD